MHFHHRASARPAFIVSGGVDMTLKVWAFPAEADVIPMATLRVAATEHGHDKDINCLAVAPNDKIIASGSHDKTAKVAFLFYSQSAADMPCS